MKLFDLGPRRPVDIFGVSKFSPIKIGNILVSVQASSFHFCEPMETFDSSDQYESFEVALLDPSLGDLIHPRFDSRFKNAFWAEHFSGPEYDKVAHFVSRYDVYLLLEDLRESFGKSCQKLSN